MNSKIAIAVSKNLRETNCPMNLVYAKVALASLQPGQVAELILDDGVPISNVSASLLEAGHEILSQNQLADGAWTVLVRKG
jgi:sulfite reductase (ferredoxin)